MGVGGGDKLMGREEEVDVIVVCVRGSGEAAGHIDGGALPSVRFVTPGCEPPHWCVRTEVLHTHTYSCIDATFTFTVSILLNLALIRPGREGDVKLNEIRQMADCTNNQQPTNRLTN